MLNQFKYLSLPVEKFRTLASSDDFIAAGANIDSNVFSCVSTVDL
jgi:hypothetical protein